MTTTGAPLEIELSIPILGGGNVAACRPTIDGEWAGKVEGLVDNSGVEGFNQGLNSREYPNLSGVRSH